MYAWNRCFFFNVPTGFAVANNKIRFEFFYLIDQRLANGDATVLNDDEQPVGILPYKSVIDVLVTRYP